MRSRTTCSAGRAKKDWEVFGGYGSGLGGMGGHGSRLQVFNKATQGRAAPHNRTMLILHKESPKKLGRLTYLNKNKIKKMPAVESQCLISLSVEDGTGLITYQYNGQQPYLSNPRPEAK